MVMIRTQDAGPAYERMRLPLVRGPLDPLTGTTAVHSHGKSSGRETHLLYM